MAKKKAKEEQLVLAEEVFATEAAWLRRADIVEDLVVGLMRQCRQKEACSLLATTVHTAPAGFQTHNHLSFEDWRLL
eukprot:12900050-Prorocentrum_lima.AAC.1